MILKSFQILAICTSMAATPSNFNYEQPKRANDNVSYTYTTNANDKGFNRQIGDVYVQYSNRTGGTFTNDVFFCYFETVNQTCRYLDDTPISIPINEQITDNETPTQLAKMQINAYKNLVNNQINIKSLVNIQAYTSGITQNVILNSVCYISQDDRWLTYLDQTTYGSWNNNINIIRDIENPTNGFIYTKDQQQETFTITSSTTAYTRQNTFNVPVNPNKTNYVFIYNYLTAEDDPQTSSTGIYVGVTSQDQPQAIRATYNSPITFSGEYINANVSYEVVDIPNVMFEVLTMPFTFISVAFNLTLFPNTPYQINISNLFLSIIGFLVFILIIKKLTGH